MTQPRCARFAAALLLTVCLQLTVFGASGAQPTSEIDSRRPGQIDPVLQRRIEDRIGGFRGDVGVYVRHLPTGREAAVNADETFPTASMIKVPIMVAVFDAIKRGDLDPEAELAYEDSLYYPGDDLLGSFKSGETISLPKLLLLSLTMSDNTASLWLQHLAGSGLAINNWLESHGFMHTRMNSRTPGRRPDWEEFGWGQTSPREMAALLVMIRNGEAVSPAASEAMYRTLSRSYWNDEALSQIPPTVMVASKQGAVDASKSEVLLVNAPHGDYVVCIATNNQADTSWVPTNEGYELIRDVSRTVWQYFEPASNWRPAAEPN